MEMVLSIAVVHTMTRAWRSIYFGAELGVHEKTAAGWLIPTAASNHVSDCGRWQPGRALRAVAGA